MASKTLTPPAKLPVVDADQILAAQQRNVDALTDAGRIVIDGAKAFALRQGEMMQATLEQWMATGQQAVVAKTASFKPTDPFAEVKSTYEAAIANARELAEIAMKAQNDAIGVLSKCAAANLDEMKSLAKVA
jgi:phasin family protein